MQYVRTHYPAATVPGAQMKLPAGECHVVVADAMTRQPGKADYGATTWNELFARWCEGYAANLRAPNVCTVVVCFDRSTFPLKLATHAERYTVEPVDDAAADAAFSSMNNALPATWDAHRANRRFRRRMRELFAQYVVSIPVPRGKELVVTGHPSSPDADMPLRATHGDDGNRVEVDRRFSLMYYEADFAVVYYAQCFAALHNAHVVVEAVDGDTLLSLLGNMPRQLDYRAYRNFYKRFRRFERSGRKSVFKRHVYMRRRGHNYDHAISVNALWLLVMQDTIDLVGFEAATTVYDPVAAFSALVMMMSNDYVPRCTPGIGFARLASTYYRHIRDVGDFVCGEPLSRRCAYGVPMPIALCTLKYRELVRRAYLDCKKVDIDGPGTALSERDTETHASVIRCIIDYFVNSPSAQFTFPDYGALENGRSVHGYVMCERRGHLVHANAPGAACG